jgi:carbon starvation protein CstA
VSFSVIIVCDVLLLLGAIALCAHHPQRYWSVALLTACALLTMTLAAINLRWAAWVDAYRRFPLYDPRKDITLLTLDLILLGFLVALVALFATQYARHKAARRGQTPNGRK